MSGTSKGNESKPVILEVSEAEYEQELASGIEPELALKPGPHTFRRVDASRVAKAEELEPRNIKVRITMYLDLDIVNFFKTKATRPDAAPYQTQINNALREYIESNHPDMRQSLLNDEQFIADIARRVAALSSKSESQSGSSPKVN